MAINEATMEYPVSSPTMPTQSEIDQAIEDASYPARVSFLDPDFLCFALPFAITFDLISIILTIVAFFTASIGWWVWVAIDGVAMAVIGGWIYFRTSQIIESKEEKKKEIQENLQKQAQSLEKESAEKASRIAAREAAEEASRTTIREAEQILAKEATQQEARMAVKAAAKAEGKILSRSIGKIFSKMGGRFLLKAIPLVGCIPFWTITVLETLKEK